MPVGEVCVGHGSIEPHVGERISLAFGDTAARPLAHLGVLLAGVVFPTMAGPRLVAGPVLASRAVLAGVRLVAPGPRAARFHAPAWASACPHERDPVGRT